jgi:hypothetical protein
MITLKYKCGHQSKIAKATIKAWIEQGSVPPINLDSGSIPLGISCRNCSPRNKGSAVPSKRLQTKNQESSTRKPASKSRIVIGGIAAAAAIIIALTVTNNLPIAMNVPVNLNSGQNAVTNMNLESLTYVNEQHQFSIDYPVGWIYFEIESPPVIVVFLNPDDDTFSVNVESEDMQGLSIEDYVNVSKQNLQSEYTIIDEGIYVQANSISSYYIESFGGIQPENSIQVILTGDGQNAYTISYFAEPEVYEDRLDEFYAMVDSLRYQTTN